MPAPDWEIVEERSGIALVRDPYRGWSVVAIDRRDIPEVYSAIPEDHPAEHEINLGRWRGAATAAGIDYVTRGRPETEARQWFRDLCEEQEALDTPDDLPARLRETRRARGLTQAEAGERLGVSRDTIGRWERGEEPLTGTAAVAVRCWLEHGTR